MKTIDDRSTTRRMVCHACGFKLPVGAITSIGVFDCCPVPEPHFHDVTHPCERCADEPRDAEVQS